MYKYILLYSFSQVTFLTNLFGSFRIYSHFPIIEQHPVHGVDGSVCSLVGLKVNESVAFGPFLVTNNLQRQNILKQANHKAFAANETQHE